MSATTTVLYPKGTNFKMDYYMSTHMPLVQKNWGSYGLKSWKVLQFDNEQPYCVQATLEWNTADDFGKAAQGPEAKEVLGDIPNFADKDPVIMPGSIVGTS